MNHQPKISIITVSYNAVNTIEETILSVINQTYSNIEYIIIDGGSTDGTIDIIKKYADKITYWVSEPDKGIYDAMNKGALIATGKYIQYLNSSDILYKTSIITEIILRIPNKDNYPDIIYGDMIIEKRFGTFYMQPTLLSEFYDTFPMYHPSSWIKKELLQKIKFDTNFKISADFNLFRNLYYSGYKFYYIPIAFTIFEGICGISSTSHYKSWLEKQIIINNKQPKHKVFYKKYQTIFSQKIKSIIYCILDLIFPNLRDNIAFNTFMKDKRVKYASKH